MCLRLLSALVLILVTASSCASQDSLKQQAAAACEGRQNFGYGKLDKTTAAKCDSMIEATVEVLAAIENERGEGAVCIARGFDMAKYKQDFMNVLRDPETPLSEIDRFLLTNFRGQGAGKEDCGWQPEETIGSLDRNCRWIRILFTKDRAKFDATARELGLPADRKTFELATESLMRCEGYYKGAVMAGKVAGNLYAAAVYCRPGELVATSMDLEDLSLERLRRVVEPLESRAKTSDGLAADFVHATLSKEFRCPRSTS